LKENERNRNAKTANRPDAKLGAQLYWMASADGTMATPVLLVVDRDIPPALVIFDGEAKQLKEMASLFAAELAVALGIHIHAYTGCQDLWGTLW